MPHWIFVDGILEISALLHTYKSFANKKLLEMWHDMLIWRGQGSFEVRSQDQLKYGKHMKSQVKSERMKCKKSQKCRVLTYKYSQSLSKQYCIMHTFRPVTHTDMSTVGILQEYISKTKYYFNTCTVHLSLFCTMTNKCTIISQIITLLHPDSVHTGPARQ